MTPLEIVAQGISFVAMAMNILSYQQRTQKGVLTFQRVGSMLFAVSFFLLGAYAGALLNAVGITRALVFINRDRLHATHPAWLCGYTLLYVASYVLVFTVFAKAPTTRNLIVEVLPVVGMTLTTVSFRFRDAKTIRRFGLVNSPLWLIYNVFCFSLGAILCETISLVSIVIGTIRFDLKKTES